MNFGRFHLTGFCDRFERRPRSRLKACPNRPESTTRSARDPNLSACRLDRNVWARVHGRSAKKQRVTRSPNATGPGACRSGESWAWLEASAPGVSGRALVWRAWLSLRRGCTRLRSRDGSCRRRSLASGCDARSRRRSSRARGARRGSVAAAVGWVPARRPVLLDLHTRRRTSRGERSAPKHPRIAARRRQARELLPGICAL